MFDDPIRKRPDGYDKRVALVLQGGGALGSYQAGVYEALAAADYLPDWVAGISIGAINAALIAGNAPEHRVDRLRAFWQDITTPLPLPDSAAERKLGASIAVMKGQRGFFTPRTAADWWMGPAPVSYYDTAPLRATLERLVDFDRINAKEVQLSVGAVNVATGNMVYFNNVDRPIRPEHIMASGALPPGFPSVEIDGAHYWDGGLVSNTPLEFVLRRIPRRSRLAFQVDVFPARGPVPTTLEAATEREKDIRYSSRTRAGTDHMKLMQDLRRNVNALIERLPPELRDTPEAEYLYRFGCVTTMDIVQLIYRPGETQGSQKDYSFGRPTMEARWAQGLHDAEATLRASPWLAPAAPDVGARTFDVLAARMRATRESVG